MAAWSISAVVGAATLAKLAGVGDASGVDADAPIFMTRADQSGQCTILIMKRKVMSGPSRRKLRGVVVVLSLQLMKDVAFLSTN